jgi:hypothetical protein
MENDLAKGQKRSNRELKKPKAEKRAPAVATSTIPAAPPKKKGYAGTGGKSA